MGMDAPENSLGKHRCFGDNKQEQTLALNNNVRDVDEKR